MHRCDSCLRVIYLELQRTRSGELDRRRHLLARNLRPPHTPNTNYSDSSSETAESLVVQAGSLHEASESERDEEVEADNSDFDSDTLNPWINTDLPHP